MGRRPGVPELAKAWIHVTRKVRAQVLGVLGRDAEERRQRGRGFLMHRLRVLRGREPALAAQARWHAHVQRSWGQSTFRERLPRSEMLLKELARALLLGGPDADSAALVEAVLSSERVQLALEVQKGGALAARRAIELAAIVLRG